jgi:uncharacterized protein (DUF2267 family)
VFDVLSKRIKFDEAYKIASMLPRDVWALWPSFVQEGVKARQSGAA